MRRPRRGRGWAALVGNGAALVRERAVAKTIQRRLERLYQIDRLADVGGFVRAAGTGERETLLVRDAGDGTLEMALQLPMLKKRGLLDLLCQIIEGVSHFVYLADRARAEREATQLELELQAEVDKFVVLASSMQRLDERSSAALRSRLFEGVTFAHSAGSELGERYRLANELAARFVRRLERDFIAPRRFGELHRELRRFYRSGQEDKLRLGRAA